MEETKNSRTTSSVGESFFFWVGSQLFSIKASYDWFCWGDACKLMCMFVRVAFSWHAIDFAGWLVGWYLPGVGPFFQIAVIARHGFLEGFFF